MNQKLLVAIITLFFALNIYLGWLYNQQKNELNQVKIQQQIMYLKNLEMVKKANP